MSSCVFRGLSIYLKSRRINTKYPKTSRTPSNLLFLWLPFIIGIKATEKRSITGSSKKRVSLATFNGLINATDPIIMSILKILLPIIFPTQISASFLKALTTDVAISGIEVPKATAVKPITMGLMPRSRDKFEEPLTSHSAPKYTAVIPTINRIN